MRSTTLFAFVALLLSGCGGAPKMLYPSGENRIPFISPTVAVSAASSASAPTAPNAAVEK